jgi:hypothetical protein
MKISDAKPNLSIGFLTVIDYPESGLFGGYLVLNRLGRPMEFHCTAPIKPSRAQQILYGATLEPYLYGEQIGRALVGAAKTQPAAILTDRRPALALRELVEMPVVYVLDDDAQARIEEATANDSDRNASATWRTDSAHAGDSRLAAFHLGRNRLAAASWAVDDPQIVANRLSDLAESFDFREPFERIREAIEEARRGG